jgi:hypothetical protein
MSRLTTATRRDLKPSQFAGPNETYPIPDRGHAVAAKARASEMHNKGLMGVAAEARIDAAANRELRRSK